MEFSKEQSIIEAMLFAAGREVSVKELTNVLELSAEDIDKIILNMKTKLHISNNRQKNKTKSIKCSIRNIIYSCI